MKSFFCPVICVCLFFLSGCRARIPDPVETFCDADVITVTTGELIFSMERCETGCTFYFATPELLAPLELFYDGKVLHAVYEDLETDVADGVGVVPLILYRAVCAFESGVAVQRAENIRAVTLDETEFLLYYDTEGGLPICLETKGADGVFCFDILSCTENDDDAESSCTDTSE